MAVPLTVGDVVLARIWCDTGAGGGQASCNVLHYIVAAIGAIPANDLDVATTLDTLVHTDFKACLCSEAAYRGVQAQILNPLPPNAAKYLAQFTIANTGPGTSGVAIMPPQVCGLISIQTANAGQAYRGRTYLPWPSTTDDTGTGTPNTPYLANAVAVSNVISSGLAVSASGRTATLVRIILHRKGKNGTTPGPSPVTNASVAAKWATQRRRGDYGRQNRSPI